jgi:DNA-binding CsgD family transcriptional regulator
VASLKDTKIRIEGLLVSSKNDIILTARQEELVRMIRDNGSMNARDILAAMKISRARVNQIIQPLIKYGIIEAVGKARATVYRLR